MRTLVISDLHLGASSGADVLRRPGPRAALVEALGDVDLLVLLGDVLELRHGPRRAALAAARPLFEELGRALAGREIVIVPGNHDHAIVESWLRRRDESPSPPGGLAGVSGGDGRAAGPPGAPAGEHLGLEQRIAAADASSMAGTLAEWTGPASVSVAYPGLWLRSDVYATHGHQLDCHLTVPTMERLAIALTARALRRPTDELATVDDYEAVSGPVFAWIDAVARQAPTGRALNGQTTVRMWRALNGDRRNGSSKLDLRSRAIAGAFPLAVAALNRAGLGSFSAEISVPELRRAGLRAMGEVAARLGLGDSYVVFGHTHRAGPLERDRDAEWRGAGGARLVNAGCWVYDPYFAGVQPGQNPYWPGTAVLIDDDAPPELLRLLYGMQAAELRGSA